MHEIKKMKQLNDMIDIAFAVVMAVSLLGAVIMFAFAFEAAADDVIFVPTSERVGEHTWSMPDSACHETKAESTLDVECHHDDCESLVFTLTAEVEMDNGVSCPGAAHANHGRFFVPRARYRLENAPDVLYPKPCQTEVVLRREPSTGFTAHAVAGVYPTRGQASGRRSFEVRAGQGPAQLVLDEVTHLAHGADDGTLAKAATYRKESTAAEAVFHLCDEISVQALYGADANLNGPLSYASTMHYSQVTLTASTP